MRTTAPLARWLRPALALCVVALVPLAVGCDMDDDGDANDATTTSDATATDTSETTTSPDTTVTPTPCATDNGGCGPASTSTCTENGTSNPTCGCVSGFEPDGGGTCVAIVPRPTATLAIRWDSTERELVATVSADANGIAGPLALGLVWGPTAAVTAETAVDKIESLFDGSEFTFAPGNYGVFDTNHYYRAYAMTGDGTYGYSAAQMVTVPPAILGERFRGATVVFVDSTGRHGRLAAITDVSEIGATPWGCGMAVDAVTGEVAIGDGPSNTAAIIAVCGTQNTAAKHCSDFTRQFQGTSLTDWYLPSLDELLSLAAAVSVQGGVYYPPQGDGLAWSSSRANNGSAVGVVLPGGDRAIERPSGDVNRAVCLHNY